MLILLRKMCFHFSHAVARFSVLLLLLFSLPFVAQAQGCPELQTSDFSIVSAAGNTDCHTPGALIVTYRNNVVGFEKLMFEVSKDNVTFAHPVETTQLSAPTTVPLPGWNAGDHIYLRVTAYCSGTSKQLVLTVPDYATAASSAVSAHVETTPAGGCTTMGGSVTVSLDKVSGFSQVEYRLYSGGSQIASETSTTPYLPTKFYNLPAGDHTLVVRATPSCTPATPGADWKDGAYEKSISVKVDYFNLQVAPILSRGTCDGGVAIRASRVMGVQKIKYEIFTAGGVSGGASPLLQKETIYPVFTHTFLPLAIGHYELRATTDCGVSVLVPFEVKVGSPGTLSASVLQNSYAPSACAVGKIAGTVPGTTIACPVDYVLTPSDGGTPIVKNGVTTEEVVFDDLAKGTYTLKGTWASQSQTTTVTIGEASLGTIKLTSEPADKVCDPTGSVTAKLEGGNYFESGILELEVDGTVIRTVSVGQGQRDKKVIGLAPGTYIVRYKTLCGASIESSVTVGYAKPVYVSFNVEASINIEGKHCTGQSHPVYEFLWDIITKDNDEGTKAFFDGATYELYNMSGNLVGSGPLTRDYRNKPYGQENQYLFQSSEGGNLTLKLRSACGTPVYSVLLPGENVQNGISISTGGGNICGKGTVSVSFPSSDTSLKFKTRILRKSDLSVVADVERNMADGTYYTYENIPTGDYIFEAYPTCAPTEKTRIPFTQKADVVLGEGYPKVTPASPSPTAKDGKVEFYFDVYSPAGVTRVYTFTNDVTGETFESTNALEYMPKYENLPAGDYTLRVKTKGASCPIPDRVYHVKVTTAAFDRVPGGRFRVQPIEGISNPCVSDGKAEVYWEDMPSDYSGPITWEILDIETKAVLASKVATDPTQHTVFDHLPLKFIVKGITAKGTFYEEDILGGMYLVYNSDFKNLFKTIVSPLVLGCSGGTIRVLAPLKAAGYTDQPTKIKLTRMYFPNHYSFTDWDSIQSPKIIEDYTFKNVPPGEYQVSYYGICGVGVTPSNVTVSSASDVPSITVETVKSLPCKQAEVKVTINNVDGGANVKLNVVDHNTGVTVLTKNLVGSGPHNLFLYPAEYDFNATVKGQCVKGTATTTYTVDEQSMTVNANYPYYIEGCPNSGTIQLSVPDPGNLTKVSYSYTKQVTGEVNAGDVTGDVTKPFTFANLTAGIYDVKAVGSCQFDDGTYKEYEWTQSIKLHSEYTPFQAVPSPDDAFGSMACPTGSIGVALTGGWKERYKVFITAGPSGAVVPEREIERRIKKNNSSWGSGLAPGTYSIHATDGCKDIYLTGLVVPNIPDELTNGRMSENEFRLLDFCAGYWFRGPVFDTQSAFDTRKEIEKLYSYYEVALVPHGVTPTEDKWSAMENLYGGLVWDNVQNKNVYKKLEDYYSTIMPIFDYTQGMDICIRVKGCPATARAYPTSPVFRTNFSDTRPECRDYRFHITNEDVCRPVDIVITRTSDNHEMLRQDNYTFTGGTGNSYYYPSYPDPVLPNDTYNFKVTDHKTGEVLINRDQSAFSNTVTMGGMAPLETPSCTATPYNVWLHYVCPPYGKYVLYDATNTKVAESSYSDITSWMTPTLPSGQNYTVEYVDAAGNNQLSSRYSFTTGFETPSSYTYTTKSLGDYCNYKQEGWTPNPREAVITWPSGSTGSIPSVSRVEIKDIATGTIWYNVGPFSFNSGNTFDRWGKWTRHNTDGTEVESDILPFGNFTFSVTDACGVKTSSFSVTYKKPAMLDLSETEVSMDCQGKFTVTPKGRAYYPDRSDPITITDIVFKGDTYNWGSNFETYDTDVYVYASLQFQDGTTCRLSWRYDLSRYTLQLDDSQTSSFFCASTGRGQVTMALKGGRPPYTYTLKKPDGTIVATKSGLPGAVLFEEGLQGEKYIIDATDACGNSIIHQNVTIHDPVQLGYMMDRTYDFCEGEQATFSALNLNGATYTWEYPDGSTTHGKNVTITTSTATAGEYKVHVQPQTCTTTIDAKVKVNVARVKESWKKETKRVCSGQNAVFNIGKPTALLNGVPSTTQKYQWQVSSDTTSLSNWKAIAGATSETLDYTPTVAGTFYVRRITMQGSCRAYSFASTLIAEPGLTSVVSPDELSVVIDHKNPFTLTAGFLSGNPNRTYQWQRSIDKVSWTNIGTDETYTETQQYAPRVYYRRIATAGICSTESPIITVRFKKRYPALINPQLRQRVKQD